MTEAEIVLGLYRTELHRFMRLASRELAPDRHVIANWHQEVIADALRGCIEGATPRLIINAPPPHLDNALSAVALAVFALGCDPRRRISLIVRDQRAVREVLEHARSAFASIRMRQVFPHLRANEVPQGFRVNRRGSLSCSAVDRPSARPDTDLVILVDPMSTADALDEARREFLNTSFDQEIAERARGATFILLAPRRHHDDLSAHLLRSNEAWAQVSLSAIATVDETWPRPHRGVVIRRTGEALQPALVTTGDLRARLLQLGAAAFAASYQQAPTHSGREYRTGWFYEPREMSEWTPDMGLPGCFGGRVPEIDYLLHDLFGEEAPPQPLPVGGVLTVEQWEQAGIWQQRQLEAAMARDQNNREG